MWKNKLLKSISTFLCCHTPEAWVNVAVNNQEILLLDHAHCEKKAASAALNLIYHYPQHSDLMQKMSRIVREEMRHFEQVLAFMQKRNFQFKTLQPGRYAKELHRFARNDHQGRLVDLLIIGALVEARSCERFALLAERLDDEELVKFYQSLLLSEARHFEIYLHFATNFSSTSIQPKVEEFVELEKKLILSDDTEFRFHSGNPNG